MRPFADILATLPVNVAPPVDEGQISGTISLRVDITELPLCAICGPTLPTTGIDQAMIYLIVCVGVMLLTVGAAARIGAFGRQRRDFSLVRSQAHEPSNGAN